MLQIKLGKLAAVFMAGTALVYGQTQVDLKTQSKTVDFTQAPETRPVKTGTAIPATCAVGDLYFLTIAIAGANVYGCTSVNTWTLQSGGGGGGGGSVTVDNSSTVVGSRGTLNFIPNIGIMNLISDTGTQINIQQSVDASYVETRTQEQTGQDQTISCSSGNSTVYACTPNGNVLTAYTDQQRFGWKPDVNCGIAPTINISTLGAKQMYRSDGSAIQAGDCTAGAQVGIWYDVTASSGVGGFKLTHPSTPPFLFKSVAFTATPAFAFGSGASTFEITLTANVTSSTVSGAVAGQGATFIVCQDATGSWTFAWPAGFKGTMTIGTTASKCNVQNFVFDGTSYYATAAGLTNQ